MPTYPGLAAYGGDIVSADDINANIAVVYVKANSESRNTTTTLANDGELVGIPLGVGVWSITLDLFWIMNTSLSGIKTQWAFTGTWNSPIRFCLGAGDGVTANATAPGSIPNVNFGGYAANTQDAKYSTANASSVYVPSQERVNNAIVTVAGVLSLQWAQWSSSATPTLVQPGTSFTVRQISE